LLRRRGTLTPAFAQQRPHRAALLVEQRDQHMHRLDEVVVAADRQRLRVSQRLLELAK
jgi:hypothetical protein